MRRPAVRLLLLALLLAGGLCASVLAVGLRLSSPVPAAVGPPPAGLPGAEAVQIPSASGSLLQGWWIAGSQGEGAVVLLHGVWSNRLSLVRRARLLREHGFAAALLAVIEQAGRLALPSMLRERLAGLDALLGSQPGRDGRDFG